MKTLLSFAALGTVIHVALRLAGAAEHTSFLAGQPLTDASSLLGPAYVVSYLAFVVLVPIAILGSIFEAITRKLIDARGPAVADR